jgi:hypothetical protein
MGGLESGEDFKGGALLFFFGAGEALGLQVEHSTVAAAERNQFVVSTEFYNAALLKDTDTVGVTDGGEAVGNQDGGAVPGGSEKALEYFGFAAHVKLSGGLVEENDTGTEFYRGEGAGQGDALPLSSGKIRAAVVTTGEDGIEFGQVSPTSGFERTANHIVSVR